MADKSRRQELEEALRSQFPDNNAIANGMVLGKNGNSEGFTTDFKRRIGKLIATGKPAFEIDEISAITGIPPRVLRIWENKYKRGHFDTASARDDIIEKVAVVPIVELEEYRSVLRPQIKILSDAHSFTDAQYQFIYNSMMENVESHYREFRENDGDWDSLIPFIELVFLDKITDPSGGFDKIKNLEQTMAQKTMQEQFDNVQSKIAAVKSHWDNLTSGKPAVTEDQLRCYVLPGKPASMQNVLEAIVELPWSSKNARNVALGKLLNYHVTYVGPHVACGQVPLTILAKAKTHLVRLPDGVWMMLPHHVLEYIVSCKTKTNTPWMWEALLLPDCPIPRMPIRSEIDTDSPDDMLFGSELPWENRWEAYTEVVRLEAPEEAIAITTESTMTSDVLKNPFGWIPIRNRWDEPCDVTPCAQPNKVVSDFDGDALSTITCQIDENHTDILETPESEQVDVIQLNLRGMRHIRIDQDVTSEPTNDLSELNNIADHVVSDYTSEDGTGSADVVVVIDGASDQIVSGVADDGNITITDNAVTSIQAVASVTEEKHTACDIGYTTQTHTDTLHQVITAVAIIDPNDASPVARLNFLESIVQHLISKVAIDYPYSQQQELKIFRIPGDPNSVWITGYAPKYSIDLVRLRETIDILNSKKIQFGCYDNAGVELFTKKISLDIDFITVQAAYSPQRHGLWSIKLRERA